MTSALLTLRNHSKIIFALMLRELATRYGRNNLGFLWIIVEPLLFCVGVLILYRSINGPYVHGYTVVSFILTGYMPMILVRHMVTYSVNGVKVNASLLYHESIAVLDLLLSRSILEFLGVSTGFVVVYLVLLVFNLVPVPHDLGLMYTGWALQGFNAVGFALAMGCISEIQEVMERLVNLIMYVLIPVSGTFTAAAWLPPVIRKAALSLPFMNDTEMIRAGLIGTQYHPYYDIGYTAEFGAVLLVLGLLLVRHVRDSLEIG